MPRISSKNFAKTADFSSDALENLKAWVGDSKLVDKKGMPLKVYHGSPNLNEETYPEWAFDYDKIGNSNGLVYGGGFYTTPDYNHAMGYVDNDRWITDDSKVLNMYSRMKKPFYVFDQERGDPFIFNDEINYRPFSFEDYITILRNLNFVSTKKQNDFINDKIDYRGLFSPYKNFMSLTRLPFSRNILDMEARDVFDVINDITGYDGIVVNRNPKAMQLINFFPEDLKSVNSKDFNPSDARINYGLPPALAAGAGLGAMAMGAEEAEAATPDGYWHMPPWEDVARYKQGVNQRRRDALDGGPAKVIEQGVDTDSPFRGFGLGLRNTLSGLESGITLGLSDIWADARGGKTAAETVSDWLDLPTPKTDTERTLGAIQSGAIDGLASGIGLGSILKQFAHPVVKGVGEVLSSSPKMDAGIGAGFGGLLDYLTY